MVFVLTYKYASHKQYSQEFKHLHIVLQATRANYVDETWEGLAFNTHDFIFFNSWFIWNDIRYVILYGIK